ncbi:RNA-directed DNA polymerase, eukaryota [Tanacetum coccineum]
MHNPNSNGPNPQVRLGPNPSNSDQTRSDTMLDIENPVDEDVVATVTDFFATATFPPGCNSSFIAFISKIQDAKVVKDFRPISLIGSMYKIIAKIMANRLSLVILDIISDVQSAFVSNRQVLDGPFILNELLSWCKLKKSKALIFKVDFEKAFDSVRWDYLNDVLKSFGFGKKWRSWIDGCLKSAMGSILGNKSPTSKFQFHKDLKQVMDSGLYKGVSINESFMLSYLFYVDDVVFVGEWRDSNINNIVHVLQLDNAAKKVGCGTFTALFHYLGVKVGGSVSRKSSFITAVHGSRGAFDGTSSASRTSPWLDIIQVLSSLKSKGIDLLGFAKKKVGNGEKTLFWDDLWIGEEVLKS